jgi:hypothetical protein
MSASEVWVLAPQPTAMGEGDAAWLERWFTEALGVRVHLVLKHDDGSADVPAGVRAAYAEESLRPALCDALRLSPRAADLCDLALLRLRRMRRSDGNAAALDEVIADIGRRLDARWPELARLPTVPRPYRCAVVLTHDVDSVDRWTGQHVAHLAYHVRERLSYEGARALLRLPWAAARRSWDRQDLHARIDGCLEAERRHKASATYLFFSPEAGYRTALDGWYTPETRYGRANVAALWRRMTDEGFDVGLHLSIGAHQYPDAIVAEWRALRAAVPAAMACRSHYLKVVPGTTDTALAWLVSAST